MPLRILAGLLALVAAAWLAAPASAQEASRPGGMIVEQWTETLDQAAQEIAGPYLPDQRAEALKTTLAQIEAEARALKAKAQAEVGPLKAQLEALGPPPAEGEPAEADEIAAQRKKIGEDVAHYQARVKQADLTVARVQELTQQIAARTIERSIEVLFELYPFPLAPGTIAVAVPDFFRNVTLIARSPYDWWTGLSAEQREAVVFYRFAIVVVLAVAVGWVLRWALLRWFGRDPAVEAPTYVRRLTGAIAEGLAYGIVPALILGGFLARALGDQAVISGLFSDVFVAFCAVAIMVILAWALPRAALAPDLPAWRLLPIRPDNAQRISRRITFLAVVFGIDLFLAGSSRSMIVWPELTSLYTLITKTIEAIAILTLMRGSLWVVEETEAPPAATEGGPPVRLGRWGFWTTLRRVIGLIALAVIATALIGYSNLSAYMAESVVISGMVVGLLVLVRGLLRELIGAGLRSRFLQVTLAVPHKSRNRYKFWLRGLLDLVIYAGGAALISIVWGVPPRDLVHWLAQVVQEFKIGNVTISLTDIAVGLFVFIVAMTLTRGLQRLLNERVFPQTDLDIGVRHSLSAGLGYVGLAMAAALAISAVGLDLSNIAIIAGALSVGIGFGLQNVVNNFVSGLILLAERPLKVGDWIVVGAHEGYVKRINVRATELETFQRASVIVPNSELLSSAVINWTHKDRYGRVEVPVGVAYGSDVARVMEVLQGCLIAHEGILSAPEPYVLFQGFGDSSLDFEARGYIANVEYRITVASALRVAIARAFEEAGIEIPFPQRDLHIKSTDGIEPALAQAVSRARAPAARLRNVPSEGDD